MALGSKALEVLEARGLKSAAKGFKTESAFDVDVEDTGLGSIFVSVLMCILRLGEESPSDVERTGVAFAVVRKQ